MKPRFDVTVLPIPDGVPVRIERRRQSLDADGEAVTGRLFSPPCRNASGKSVGGVSTAAPLIS
jgi:hypothetical protein